jgi:FSR family fosmidomycin resistance protein-like MFS transporter
MKYRLIGLISAAHLITDINQGAIPALLPFLIASHNLSYAAGAGIVLAANISSTIVQPLFGHAADRFSKPWLMPAGLTLAGLGVALTGVVPNYRLILVSAFVGGLGVAAFHPEAARLVFFAAAEKKGSAMSFFGVGGILGFALGPLFATMALLQWGIKGTLALLVPVGLMAVVVVFQLPRFSSIQGAMPGHKSGSGSGSHAGVDEWKAFARLTIIVIGRSIVFFGLNTFIPLYWIHVLNQSKAAGGTALTVMGTSAVFGNLLGGKMADRFDHLKVMLIGAALLVPLLPGLIWVEHSAPAMLLLIPIGLSLSSTYSPTIVLGQRYLPNHVGLSSGITIGVAVTIGGLAAPFLGKIADQHGIRTALMLVAFVPIFITLMTLTLRQPKND